MTFGFKPKPMIKSNRAIPILLKTSMVSADLIRESADGPTIIPVII